MQDKIKQIEQLRAEAQAYLEENDVDGEWLEDGMVKDWESGESLADAQATVQTYDTVLAILKEERP